MRALVLVDPAPQQLCLALVQHDQHGEPGEGGHFQLIFMFASKFPAAAARPITAAATWALAIGLRQKSKSREAPGPPLKAPVPRGRTPHDVDERPASAAVSPARCHSKQQQHQLRWAVVRATRAARPVHELRGAGHAATVQQLARPCIRCVVGG